MRLVFNDVGVSCVCRASASHIFANRVPQRDRRWADAIRRRQQRSPVAAVPMLALTPTTLKILFHRDRASTTWAYLLVLHGIALDGAPSRCHLCPHPGTHAKCFANSTVFVHSRALL